MYIKGMEKIFRGVLKYRHKYKEDMVSWFHHINENPKPTAIFMTCVDSRMLPTRFTQTNPGDMFIARNVGNIMPHVKQSISGTRVFGIGPGNQQYQAHCYMWS